MLKAGLCNNCLYKVVVVSDKGSEFVRCTNPRLEKYPRLPVYACIGWTLELSVHTENVDKT